MIPLIIPSPHRIPETCVHPSASQTKKCVRSFDSLIKSKTAKRNTIKDQSKDVSKKSVQFKSLEKDESKDVSMKSAQTHSNPTVIPLGMNQLKFYPLAKTPLRSSNDRKREYYVSYKFLFLLSRICIRIYKGWK